MTTIAHIFDGQHYEQVVDLSRLQGLVSRPGVHVWLDTDERTEALDKILREVFHLHPLVIEDLYEDSATPKVEDWGDYLYIVMHGVRTEPGDRVEVSPLELDLILGIDWLFTHRTSPIGCIEALIAELNRNPRALARGPAFVAHALLDKLADLYVPVVEAIDETVDGIEKAVIDDPHPELLETILELKRAVQWLRRMSVYQRDITQRLSRGEFEQIPEAALAFYRDVYDQFVRVTDLAESNREMLGVVLQVHFTVTANRTNDAMKALTLISAILLPMTFVAGIYGMNFKHMPELDWRWGYPSALGIMLLIALSFYTYFKRKNWI
ncbi:MAG: magnesium/cobalt transporter CorA [Deltaproteobacteria bacterium]|nr:magnesium/cobalt transporter CorA [Deltaproteobacteria bacterium]